MQQKITSRMVSHPCRRYVWFITHGGGFPKFDNFHNWQYNLNRLIETRGVEYFRAFGWEIGEIPSCSSGNIYVTTKHTIFGGPKSEPIEGLELNTRYVLLPRSMGAAAYRRIGSDIRIHKVNINVTLEGLLNNYILIQNNYFIPPVVMFIDRANLEVHVESLFRFMPNYESMSADYYSITLHSMQSEENCFSPPKNVFHCAKCVFRKICQKDLVSHS